MAAKEPNGPDLLSDGVALAELEEGKLIRGHVGDEAVLLARVDGDILAVGASCTHYGGPLHEGLAVGDTVRCPWHHACFNLRTGEALEAPALKPLARWKVQLRGERAFVAGPDDRSKLGPLEPTALDRAANVRPPASVVIIGAGAAGSAAAEMLRRCGYDGPITLLDSEQRAPYDRPNLSKDYLAGSAPASWMPLRPADFYQQHGVSVVRAKVTGLDTQARTVQVQGGQPQDYGALLLATGAEPRTLDIPGHDLPHVFTLRSWESSDAIIQAAAAGKRAVVVGASFIGLEVAASLRERGLEVDVVAPEQKPLMKVFGPELGGMIQGLHEEHGVRFHLGRKPTAIDEVAVTLDDGQQLPADLVVVGVGVRPRLQLAEAAGLKMDNGVLVDEYLQTSAPGVFAAGDIARWPAPQYGGPIRVEHWVVAQRQGQTAARNMLGARQPFASVPFFWSKHYDTSIRYSGHAEKWDQIVIDGSLDERDLSAAFRLAGRTLAVASVKRDHQNLQAALALELKDQDALSRLIRA